MISANVRSIIRQQRQTDQGLSLIECLVAIVVISITLVAITPPIFFITATRVQSRRAEQALQLAQSEVDRVRNAVERGTYTVNILPDTVGNISTVPAPAAILGSSRSITASCNNYDPATPVPVTNLLPVDVDGDCTPDFLMQSFRTPGSAGTPVPAGFRMGVRVYADTPQLRQNLGRLTTTQASLKMTGAQAGVRSGAGGAASYSPLAILYSSIVRSDTSNSLQDYRTICPAQSSC